MCKLRPEYLGLLPRPQYEEQYMIKYVERRNIGRSQKSLFLWNPSKNDPDLVIMSWTVAHILRIAVSALSDKKWEFIVQPANNVLLSRVLET